ncbi:uncharacterized protein FRV6_00318 [Fusarium oxysporum]|uniref:Uncharacterized protein n=1 Tax=Fusarium oxysporum TaxID=5507 RepID=A0A2H3SHY5_FUSOX|nr:uncharacterized protein FRV6_00318 [Fusarium oxysporum]
MSSPTFHPVPRLPAEIRLQIWKAACIISSIPGYESYEQAGLHYVNVDTVKTGGRDRLTLRALDNKQGPNGDEEIPNNNRSAYMWDGGLWGACRLSREVITEEIYFMWLRLPDYSQGYLGRPAILTSRNTHEEQGYMVFPRRDIFCIRTTDWKSLPQHFEHWSTGLPFFDPLSSSIIPVCTLAIEFDSSWIVDLPETLEELKAENSARGLVATWIEGVASGWYNDMRERCCNDAIHAFIEALDGFLPFKEYGHLYEENNPDSWDEDLHMWFDFNIFQEIEVLVRFEYADHKEVSWIAVCNDLDDDDAKGSEKAISAYGRVYDLEYDDDVGYCIGDFGGRRGWTYPGSGERCNDEYVNRVEYIKLLDLDLERVETEVGDE